MGAEPRGRDLSGVHLAGEEGDEETGGAGMGSSEVTVRAPKREREKKRERAGGW